MDSQTETEKEIEDVILKCCDKCLIGDGKDCLIINNSRILNFVKDDILDESNNCKIYKAIEKNINK